VSNPATLIEDLQKSGIVKGGSAQAKTPAYPSSRVVVRRLDPQDAQDVETAFQDAQEALVRLGEALLRSGPPSTSGAAERLAYVRQQLADMERSLGLAESVNHQDRMASAHVAAQRAQGLLFDVQQLLRDRSTPSY